LQGFSGVFNRFSHFRLPEHRSNRRSGNPAGFLLLALEMSPPEREKQRRQAPGGHFPPLLQRRRGRREGLVGGFASFAETVSWRRATLRFYWKTCRFKNADFYIYTGDIEATPGEILEKVAKNLNVKVDKNVKFVYLTRRKWVEGAQYPYFTLLGQALGSIYLAFEAINKLVPGISIQVSPIFF
jgi:hypothetical protein